MSFEYIMMRQMFMKNSMYAKINANKNTKTLSFQLHNKVVHKTIVQGINIITNETILRIKAILA